MQLISYERRNEKNSIFSQVTGNQTTLSKDHISDTILNHILPDYFQKNKKKLPMMQFFIAKS